MVELRDILTAFGTPALIVGAAVVAWLRITQLQTDHKAAAAQLQLDLADIRKTAAELNQRMYNHVADHIKTK